MVQDLVLGLTHSLLDVVVVLRRVVPTRLTILFGRRYLVLLLQDLRVVPHAFDILSNDVILAHHRLLLDMTLLRAQSSLFASQTVVLLPALRMVRVDLHVAVEGVLLGRHAAHGVL